MVERPWKKSKNTNNNDKIYSPEDYSGEFNHLIMEKEVITQLLSLTKDYNQTAYGLKISKRTLLRRIKAHQIQVDV
jgi:transcriptional regulator with PAS, ATPase and Fis domain